MGFVLCPTITVGVVFRADRSATEYKIGRGREMIRTSTRKQKQKRFSPLRYDTFNLGYESAASMEAGSSRKRSNCCDRARSSRGS